VPYAEQNDNDVLDVDAELLPDRELMSLIDVSIPVNGTVAANVLAEDPAPADAEQDTEQTEERRGNT
jgi:hypothetical protein